MRKLTREANAALSSSSKDMARRVIDLPWRGSRKVRYPSRVRICRCFISSDRDNGEGLCPVAYVARPASLGVRLFPLPVRNCFTQRAKHLAADSRLTEETGTGSGPKKREEKE